MAYTSWGQRKALGRRYGQDPAMIMEMERLEREYGLIPGREARAQQDKALAQQQSQFDTAQSNAKSAGITGTIANLGQTGLVLRGMTKGKDEPFFGQTASNLWDKAWGNTPKVATTGMQPVAGATTYSPEMLNESINAGLAAGADIGVNPALIDATSQGLAAGADVGMGAGTAATAPSAWSTYGVPGAQALGVYEGSRMAGNLFKEDTFANRALRDPVTGLLGEGLRAVGLKDAADQINRWEKDIIQKPIDAVVDFISNPIEGIKNLFGGW